jgi:hypothetical protein
MQQCLRCYEPCGDTDIFCASCRVFLQKDSPLPQGHISDIDTTPIPASLPAFEAVAVEEYEKFPTLEVEAARNKIEQTLSRLKAAAGFMAGGKRPRASRLSRMLDMSDQIRRDSTPMPLPGTPIEREDSWAKKLLNDWDDEEDLEEDETNSQDFWGNEADPLLQRPFPNPAEMLRIEQEDIERANRSQISAPLRQRSKPLRWLSVGVTILALVALLVDVWLVSISYLRATPPAQQISVLDSPTLILSSSEVNYGQSVDLQIQHFSPQARVMLTRNIGEEIKTSTGGSTVTMDQMGSASISLPIGSDWNPGLHTIGAVDLVTHYTASVSLRVVAGPTRASQLLVSTTKLDFGTALQGANTIQPLTLQNGGSGSITWSASSDQPWLLLTPAQGMFSKSQTLVVGVQRSNLKAGKYTGKLTFSSNVGAPLVVSVEMSVSALPSDPGAVLSVNPVLLAFSAKDGGSDPEAQYLTLTNPGNEPLSWSLAIDPAQYQGSSQASNWLRANIQTGVVPAGDSSTIRISAQLGHLLPGTYLTTLVFKTANGKNALNSPQSVGVSFTVQPYCGIALSSGSLSFTAVAEHSNPSNQALTLAAMASCSEVLDWRASSTASWLTVSPVSGQLHGTTAVSVAVSVNISGLQPGNYSATLSLITKKMTQSVLVQLTVQPPMRPSAPLLAASPQNLNFSTTVGQAAPPGQSVTITNSGGSPLHWRTAFTPLASNPWLSVSPSGGTLKAGETTQLTVKVSADNVTPGSYSGQITLSATDDQNAAVSGSPQVISVNFSVFTPCTLSSPTSTSFTGTQGGSVLAPQTIAVTARGNCSWPLTWQASVVGSVGWLALSADTSTLSSAGQSASLKVTPDITGLTPGNYRAVVKITAKTASGVATGGEITVSVNLAVTGVTINGTVSTCAVVDCTAPAVLPGATVTLSSGGTTIATVTADQTGEFTFTGITLGTYTLTVSGTDNGTYYAGSMTVIVANNLQVVPITVLPG